MMRTSATLASMVLAVAGFAACSDDDDPDITVPDNLSDVSLPDVSLPDITTPDVTVPDVTLPDVSLPDLSLPESLSDVTLPDISLPDISVPNTEEVLSGIFPNLSDAQVECLADAGVESVDDVTSLLDDCGIELSDLTP